MNHFQALKKPEKPAELASPPNSPMAQQTFMTPKFSKDKSAEKNRAIEKLLIENMELNGKVTELTNAMKVAEVNYKQEIMYLAEQCRSHRQSIQEKYEQTELLARIDPMAKSCKEKIELVWEMLQEAKVSHKNLEIEDDFTEASFIEEEGKILKLGRTQTQVIDDPLSDYNKEQFGILKAEKDLEEVIKNKDKEIKKHKNFIKMLKSSLEKILQEHKKSQTQNERHLQEIAALKAELAKEPNNI